MPGRGKVNALLRLVAERLQNLVRGCDLVARLGGDEFAIVQATCTKPEEAQLLAERIIKALAEPFSLEGEQISIGTSIGIALAPHDAICPDKLLKAADVALYCAKEEGRGTYCFFELSMDRHLQAREATKRALRLALGRGEFELNYQPLVDLSTNQINSFEALLRWRHPERGVISPEDFIPIAEDTGLIIPIGEWVLEEACRAAASWPDGISVAVNLSPVQFRSKVLAQAVDHALKISGLEPGRLQLEITESVLLQDNLANLAVLQELRRLGVQIAMDDFGTGYSSLGYLRSFSFDKIKLDRSFVCDLPDGPQCEAIVQAVAGLASGLRITTTAEGIETQEQLSILRASGYDQGQGYLFGKPVSGPDVASVIERFSAA
ncbi:putative bifunctional diguanylate cyclase/phosphodiesterase [Siccirubricoccus deserti]